MFPCVDREDWSDCVDAQVICMLSGIHVKRCIFSQHKCFHTDESKIFIWIQDINGIWKHEQVFGNNLSSAFFLGKIRKNKKALP